MRCCALPPTDPIELATAWICLEEKPFCSSVLTSDFVSLLPETCFWARCNASCCFFLDTG
jgi:hypothetical protein